MITRNGRKKYFSLFHLSRSKNSHYDLKSSKEDHELRWVYKFDQIFQDVKLTLYYCQSKFNLKSSLKVVPNLELLFQNSVALILKSKLDDLGLSSDVLKVAIWKK